MMVLTYFFLKGSSRGGQPRLLLFILKKLNTSINTILEIIKKSQYSYKKTAKRTIQFIVQNTKAVYNCIRYKIVKLFLSYVLLEIRYAQI